jgi:hypothetical protein
MVADKAIAVPPDFAFTGRNCRPTKENISARRLQRGKFVTGQ